MTRTRVLVCGSRDYSDRKTLWAALDAFHATHGIATLIEGEAAGADSLAAFWWGTHGVSEGIAIERYPADWATYGRAAGPIRNRQMLTEGRPDVVLAFPEGKLSRSRGTLDMVTQARKAGVRTVVHGEDDTGHVIAGRYQGVELIAAERDRQVVEEVRTAEHDARYSNGDLALAAVCYALPDGQRRSVPFTQHGGVSGWRPEYWPWSLSSWRPSPGDRVRELVKAGALIAAEIDRLLRLSDGPTA